jgi:hypothetical protein
MPKIKYHVRLTKNDRRVLLDIISKGSNKAKEIMHANILLTADETGSNVPHSEADIAALFRVNQQTVHSIRRRYSEAGIEAAVNRKKRDTPPVEPKITGEVEARIIALSCGTPPTGRARWSLRLLADKAIELQIIDSISHEAISRLLKKRTKTASA